MGQKCQGKDIVSGGEDRTGEKISWGGIGPGQRQGLGGVSGVYHGSQQLAVQFPGKGQNGTGSPAPMKLSGLQSGAVLS